MRFCYYDGSYTVTADTLKELRRIYYDRGMGSEEVYQYFKKEKVWEPIGVLRSKKGIVTTYTNYDTGKKYIVRHDGSLGKQIN